MKEEDKIQKKIGTENPFRVPEGYFENLTSEVMNRLPEKEKLIAVQTEPTMWQKVRPWLYMTAMFIGAALIIRVASSEHTQLFKNEETNCFIGYDMWHYASALG